LKGNLDPVNVLLKGSRVDVYNKAVSLIKDAGDGGGYILSTACSVAPQAPPENISQLYRASVDNPYS
jgi:uroporphyrinogen-III decarboxylase